MKWICNKCNYETTEKPKHKNSTCTNCKKGRFRFFRYCNCGILFHPSRYNQLYCSRECMYKYRKTGGKKGKTYPHLRRAKISICVKCGKEFRAIRNFKDYEQKYCSRECWADRGKYIKCENCGIEFKAYENIRFCSKECSLAFMVGPNHPNWKDGATDKNKRLRSTKKYLEWRKAVLKRDNYTCVKCGKTQKLHAHHVKPFADYPELRYEVSNGITVCGSCHEEIHGRPILVFEKRSS